LTGLKKTVSLVTVLLASLLAVSLVATFLMASAATSSSVSTDWWGSFRHDPARTGYSTSAAPDTNKTAWNYPTDSAVRSSPTVSNGVLYVGSFGGNVYALDAATGKQLWNYTTGGQVWSSATVANGIIYIGSNDWILYALDASSGNKIWSFNTGGGVFSSPVVVSGVVYFGSTNDNVYALNAQTGATIWNYTTGNQVRSSPAVVDGVVYIASEDGYLYALDAATGTKTWSALTSPGDSFTCSSPAVANGEVYVGAHDGNVYAFDIVNGAQKWSFQTGNIVESSPSIIDNVVYVGSDSGYLYALDAATGSVNWSFNSGAAIYSSPAVASGKVYVGSWNGEIYALDASTGNNAWNYLTGGSIFASPAIANGVIYIGSYDSKVYAFGNYNAASNTPTPSPSSSSQPSANSDLLQQAWVPKPANAVVSVGISAFAIGAVSILFASASNPLGSLGGKIGEKTKDLIPDNIKKWLEDVVSSKRKLHADEKAGSLFKPTKPEAIAYITSIIILSIAFSYVKVNFLSQIWALLPVFFATSILVGFVQKFFSIAFMRSRGVWSEHKIWPFGLILFLFTTFAFKVPFSSPTRNVHQSTKFTQKLGAIVSASEILISLAFAGIFFLILTEGYVAIGGAGLAMCVIGSFFGTFPVAPMSGKDIFDHSKRLWAGLFSFTLIIFIAWILMI
jgi:outer membrane protein assembly factor BamB